MFYKLLFYLPVLLFTRLLCQAQVSDNFSDGNFTENPSWTAHAGDWIVNAAGQLQSNNTTAGSIFFITTPNTLVDDAEWELYMNLDFATSSANYADVYLMSASGDLRTADNTGYFVRIGNTTDEISLYRKDAGGAAIKIIDGADGTVGSNSNNKIKLKVTRDITGRWVLYTDTTAMGNHYVMEGTVTDSTFASSSYFGILVKQSTVAGFAQKHFFDDIDVKHITADTEVPVLLSAKAISVSEVVVLFNEPIDKISGESTANYSIDHSTGSPLTAQVDSTDPTVVHLTFANNITSAPGSQLTVNGVKDTAGNEIINASVPVIILKLHAIRPYDIVIDEIMAHPLPRAGLPDNEWIELKNTSAAAINLTGWKINSGPAASGTIPAFVLQPDSFVIVCPTSGLAEMSPFGKAIALPGFPSLNNAAGQVWITAPPGKIIHAVSYSDSWYQNELKKKGGWSLEMTDTKNPCGGGSNWKASTDIRGGTPGMKNSTNGPNPDTQSPKLLRAYAADSMNIVLVFNEPLETQKASSAHHYLISDGIGAPVDAIPFSPITDKVNLVLNQPLLANKIYTISVNDLSDCSGNNTGSNIAARVGLSIVADSLDIVINEVLFNPPPDGSDYVELYNRSNKIIDLQQIFIANRAANGAISHITAASRESYLLFPQEFVLLAGDINWVKSAYVTENPGAFIAVDLPSFNDDKGNVIVLNGQGNITDQLAYSEQWHFNLLTNTEGVSLERIDYNAPTQSQSNWHSAATSVGYGTPGYKNSQYRVDQAANGDIKISPEIISPDNDGQDDFATITYTFPEPGYVANITIFDASGRRVRYLQRNALCGTKGNFIWDGLGQNNQPLATAVYIVFVEVFNLKGNTKQVKIPIVVARRN